MELVSIIIPTLNRKSEIIELLKSIMKQSYKNIEVIIVSQNIYEYLEDIVEEYKKKIKLKYVVIDTRGASKARNKGLEYAEGEIIVFPDDDSQFFKDTIEIALKLMKTKKVNVIFGKSVDQNQKDSVSNYADNESYLSLEEHEGMFVEFTMFVYKEIICKYYYNEKYGVGTFYGAEEAYDLVLRMLKNKEKIFYSPKIKFYHPNKIVNYTSSHEIKRVFQYRIGFAKLCQEHNLKKKYYKRLFLVILYYFYLKLTFNPKNKYYFAELLGLIVGKNV